MEAAPAADLIRGSQFQSSGGCTGSRLDQEFEISIRWEAALAADFIRSFKVHQGAAPEAALNSVVRNFNHLGAALAADLSSDVFSIIQ